MFGYLRLFSIISLVVIVLISTLAGFYFHVIAEDELMQMVDKNASAMAQGYINTVWRKYSDVVVPLASGNASQLRGNAQVAQFAEDTVHYFQRMPVEKVNIYSAGGMLLMSTGGGDALSNKADVTDNAFVSEHLRHTGRASKMVENVALSSGNTATMVRQFVPMLSEAKNGDGIPEAGLEILYDVTLPWQKLLQFQWYGTGGAIGIFLVFLGLLFVTSKKAEAIIAKQHEANIDLAAAAAAAQAENRDKSQFLANISHELRTPLNAIIGFSDIIRMEVFPKVEEQKYHDYIIDIHSSGVHLLSLINDILDYSKAEAGKLELEVSEVNANKMIRNCMRLVGPRAEDGKVRLVDALPKEQFILFTDGKKFKQILLNLLSNAVKFTPPEGEVHINTWRDAHTEAFFFEVRDTGIGIAPKDISRAMSLFGQVDNKLSRKYEGTGLGLPLTKKFVELMGGKFTIESEINVGTRIVFSLPRELKPRDGIVIKQVT